MAWCSQSLWDAPTQFAISVDDLASPFVWFTANSALADARFLNQEMQEMTTTRRFARILLAMAATLGAVCAQTFTTLAVFDGPNGTVFRVTPDGTLTTIASLGRSYPPRVSCSLQTAIFTGPPLHAGTTMPARCSKSA
jgi:hypothetical protein